MISNVRKLQSKMLKFTDNLVICISSDSCDSKIPDKIRKAIDVDPPRMGLVMYRHPTDHVICTNASANITSRSMRLILSKSTMRTADS